MFTYCANVKNYFEFVNDFREGGFVLSEIGNSIKVTNEKIINCIYSLCYHRYYY